MENKIFSAKSWTEQDSNAFLQHGNCFTPNKEQVHQTVCKVLGSGSNSKLSIIELCCGGGDLAHAILKELTDTNVIAYDQSVAMLEATETLLNEFGGRYECRTFDLPSRDWRSVDHQFDGVVSSLAIHHLNAEEKQQLFSDIYTMLVKGGRLVIFDLIMPAEEVSWEIFSEAWDHCVSDRSSQLFNNQDGLASFKELEWNYYRDKNIALSDPIDKPSPLYAQLKWLEQAGFRNIEVYYTQAGHALFSGQKI